MFEEEVLKSLKLTAIACAMTLLASCGGGGGGDDIPSTPTTPNQPSPPGSPGEPIPDPDEPQPTPTDPAPTDPDPTPTDPDPAPTDPNPTPPTTSLPGPIETVPAAPTATAELNCATCQTGFKDTVVDGNGVPTVAWSENNNGVATIKAARYNATNQAWERQTIGNGTPRMLQLGVDRAGNVKAAWLAGNTFNIATFDVATSTWSPPQAIFIAPNIVSAGPKTFVVGPNGHMYFAYLLQSTATTAEGFPVQTVGAWIFNATTNTTQRGRVGAASEHVTAASIDVDDAGNAVLTWSTRLTGDEGAYRGRIYTSRFRPTNNYWGRVREQAAQGAYNPQVTLRQNGRAVLVYGVTSNGVNDLLMRQYEPVASAWSPARSVGQQSAAAALGLTVDSDQAGNAFIAWSESSRGQLIRRYNAATDSFEPVLIYDDGADVNAPDIAVHEPSGNALHSFANNAGQETTNIVRYTRSGTGWNQPQPLNAQGENGSTADVTMGPSGVGYAAWTQATGQTSGTTPVQNLRVRRVAP